MHARFEIDNYFVFNKTYPKNRACMRGLPKSVGLVDAVRAARLSKRDPGRSQSRMKCYAVAGMGGCAPRKPALL